MTRQVLENVKSFTMSTFTSILFPTSPTGEHPRFGALDVCPFIPVSPDITMDDCVECAKRFGERLAKEINVPGMNVTEMSRDLINIILLVDEL